MTNGDATEVIAATTTGKVRGLARGGVQVFKGIPFAAPPVGARRFRPPVPVEPWPDVRDATVAGPFAPQPESPLEKLLGAPPPRWDEAGCLTLNVYPPALDDAKRPVMVWIHGGAFVNGSGATPLYSGRRFVEHGDVVVVTVNYRLGALGFLHLEAVGGEEFRGAANVGLLDQVAALEWVRDNIAAFGGDPARVTVFGESAGGMSIGTLLGLPAAQGLFHQAIPQSGASSTVLEAAAAESTARRVMELCGVEAVAALQEVPAQAILDAQVKMMSAGARTALPFAPCVDGTTLPRIPLESLRSGAMGDVPVMTGTTRDEMTMFLVLDLGAAEPDPEALHRRASRWFGDRTDEVVAAYRDHRPGGSPMDLITALTTDAVFRIPAIRLAEAQVGQGRPTWMYWFTWPTPVMNGLLKSCHALELPFVWDALDRPGLSVLTGDAPGRQAIADAMHSAWIRFARDGDPGWPRYDVERRATMRFDLESEVVDDPDGDERRLWDSTHPLGHQVSL